MKTHAHRRKLPLLALAVFGAYILALSATPSAAQPRVTGEPVALTGGERFFTAPKWSPDGSLLAFSAARYEGIYTVEPSTGAIRTITDAPAAGFGFEWAPDGTTILAREARFEGHRRLDAVTLFDVRTGEPSRLTEFRTSMPALPKWDAAGANVVLYADEHLEVFSVREAEPGKRAPVAWVTSKTGLARADAEAMTVNQLDVLADQQILNARTSPDGERLAFEVLGGNLYTVNADGSGLVDLGLGHRPSWSPDGEWVVFMRSEDDGHTFTKSDLYAARSDGSQVVQLTSSPDRLEMNPDWSPEGTRIAYDDFTDGIIYLLPIAY